MEKTHVHHAAGRRDSSLAAGGAHAAGEKSPARRASLDVLSLRRDAMAPGIPPGSARAGMGNISIEYRYAEARLDRLPDLATDLVRLNVDLIFTDTPSPAFAARNAT